ncbi:hypothetical protein NEOLI_000934 [Neolecta irregularis DAH-3]|uniref:Uncharacterized protein n=1 Tax=Neolecta irregularis (strain DAH-3) TaxID=1198029 RepID=A0A1U7LW59_NEOID|nr:hypothetical protein NEOLI_000934 [Neolecta irregularis DAH-3]|eukprot:OLL26858.1 hypothetical protein NEOLI_000934 [Neolecta irregularis DAH-3]
MIIDEIDQLLRPFELEGENIPTAVELGEKDIIDIMNAIDSLQRFQISSEIFAFSLRILLCLPCNKTRTAGFELLLKWCSDLIQLELDPREALPSTLVTRILQQLLREDSSVVIKRTLARLLEILCKGCISNKEKIINARYEIDFTKFGRLIMSSSDFRTQLYCVTLLWQLSPPRGKPLAAQAVTKRMELFFQGILTTRQFQTLSQAVLSNEALGTMYDWLVHENSRRVDGPVSLELHCLNINGKAIEIEDSYYLVHIANDFLTITSAEFDFIEEFDFPLEYLEIPSFIDQEFRVVFKLKCEASRYIQDDSEIYSISMKFRDLNSFTVAKNRLELFKSQLRSSTSRTSTSAKVLQPKMPPKESDWETGQTEEIRLQKMIDLAKSSDNFEAYVQEHGSPIEGKRFSKTDLTRCAGSKDISAGIIASSPPKGPLNKSKIIPDNADISSRSAKLAYLFDEIPSQTTTRKRKTSMPKVKEIDRRELLETTEIIENKGKNGKTSGNSEAKITFKTYQKSKIKAEKIMEIDIFDFPVTSSNDEERDKCSPPLRKAIKPTKKATGKDSESLPIKPKRGRPPNGQPNDWASKSSKNLAAKQSQKRNVRKSEPIRPTLLLKSQYSEGDEEEQRITKKRDRQSAPANLDHSPLKKSRITIASDEDEPIAKIIYTREDDEIMKDVASPVMMKQGDNLILHEDESSSTFDYELKKISQPLAESGKEPADDNPGGKESSRHKIRRAVPILERTYSTFHETVKPSGNHLSASAANLYIPIICPVAQPHTSGTLGNDQNQVGLENISFSKINYQAQQSLENKLSACKEQNLILNTHISHNLAIITGEGRTGINKDIGSLGGSNIVNALKGIQTAERPLRESEVDISHVVTEKFELARRKPSNISLSQASAPSEAVVPILAPCFYLGDDSHSSGPHIAQIQVKPARIPSHFISNSSLVPLTTKTSAYKTPENGNQTIISHLYTDSCELSHGHRARGINDQIKAFDEIPGKKTTNVGMPGTFYEILQQKGLLTKPTQTELKSTLRYTTPSVSTDSEIDDDDRLAPSSDESVPPPEWYRKMNCHQESTLSLLLTIGKIIVQKMQHLEEQADSLVKNFKIEGGAVINALENSQNARKESIRKAMVNGRKVNANQTQTTKSTLQQKRNIIHSHAFHIQRKERDDRETLLLEDTKMFISRG